MRSSGRSSFDWFFRNQGRLFTIAKGGVFHVYGPAASFIAGNNEIALAIIMVIPLMRYLQLNTTRPMVHLGLGAAMLLSAIAAVGSQSRGALLAIIAMAFLFWIRSRGKLLSGLLICTGAAAVAAVMPAEWYARMATIESYEQDGSAMGRINAWWFAWNLAKTRPLVGGGFETFQAPLFAVFAPDPYRVHDVHSIYFEVLGEHGFVGLALFVLLGMFAWRSADRIVKLVQKHPEFKSYGDLARMLQASIIGYATGGAFLGLAYFDLYYHLVAAVVIARKLIEYAIAQQAIGKGEQLSQVAVSSRSIAPLPNASASAPAMGRGGGATVRAGSE